MAYQDLLQVEICKLFEEFALPKNVLPVFQQKKFLERKEIELVEARTTAYGPLSGARLLFDKLTEKTDWFEKLQIVLRDKNVKLEHIAELMIRERERIEIQSASRRFTRFSSHRESFSTLYIKRNKELEQTIHELFVAKIGDPSIAVNVVRKLNKKVLTKIDAENVNAKVNNEGTSEGAHLLFQRLVLYKSWPDVLKKVFEDPAIMKPEIAREIEALASKIKAEYKEQKSQIKHLYQMNEPPQLADNRMETDGPSSNIVNETKRRPLQDISESDCAERRPALKKQARSYKDKENSLSSGITEGDLDLASGGSSESRNATAGKTELMSAAASGNMDLLLCLIKEGANLNETNSKGRTALMYAVSKRKFPCVQELVSNGCDVNKRDGLGCTALMISAQKDFTLCMKYLIKKNSDVDNTNINGATALMVAATEGFVGCMRLLIRAGCNIDKCHNTGMTALSHAAFHGHSECVDLLIQSGCDVNIADNKGVTALMFAAQNGHVKCMNLLISGHANVNLKDEEGKTAVMYAVLSKQIECLKILIDRQADITIANKSGDTPLTLAI